MRQHQCQAGGTRIAASGIQPRAKSGKDHDPDYELVIHYTFGSDDASAALGSITVVMSPGGGTRDLWRFGDDVQRPVDFTKARRFE